MKHNIDAITKALAFDSLAEAEKLTGKSYKEDEATSWLGMGLAMTHNARKKELLQFAGDTYFGMTPQEFMTKLAAHGFVKLLEEPFVGYPGETDERAESLFLYWEPTRGILVKFESYGGYPISTRSLSANGYDSSCNSINFYFNWRAHKRGDFWPPHLSGGMVERDRQKPESDEDEVYDPNKPNCATISGDIDGREGMFNAIDWMDERGAFETPWVERPSLWLINYAEKLPKELDNKWPQSHEWYEAVNERRLAKLPPEVQACLGQPWKAPVRA